MGAGVEAVGAGYQPARQEDGTRTELFQQEQEHKTLAEAMQDAREAAEEQRSRFQIRSNINYRYAALEAYARLARAKSKGDVSAAAGYARRRLYQLKVALRGDSDRASEIRAVMNQLRKVDGRAAKKRRDLEREALLEQYRRRAAEERQRKENVQLQQELKRRRLLRTVREGAYLHEAAIDGYLRAQQTAALAEMELPGGSTSSAVGTLGGAAVPQQAGVLEGAAVPAVGVAGSGFSAMA